MQLIEQYEIRNYPSIQKISMPASAKLLSVTAEGTICYLHALVETDNATETRVICVTYTGFTTVQIPKHAIFICAINNKQPESFLPYLVTHVFDLGVEEVNDHASNT